MIIDVLLEDDSEYCWDSVDGQAELEDLLAPYPADGEIVSSSGGRAVSFRASFPPVEDVVLSTVDYASEKPDRNIKCNSWTDCEIMSAAGARWSEILDDGDEGYWWDAVDCLVELEDVLTPHPADREIVRSSGSRTVPFRSNSVPIGGGVLSTVGHTLVIAVATQAEETSVAAAAPRWERDIQWCM